MATPGAPLESNDSVQQVIKFYQEQIDHLMCEIRNMNSVNKEANKTRKVENYLRIGTGTCFRCNKTDDAHNIRRCCSCSVYLCKVCREQTKSMSINDHIRICGHWSCLKCKTWICADDIVSQFSEQYKNNLPPLTFILGGRCFDCHMQNAK